MNQFYLTVQQSCELRETLEALAMLLDSAACSPAAFLSLADELNNLADSLSPLSPVRQLINNLLSVPRGSSLSRQETAKIWNAIDELWNRCRFDDPIFLNSEEVRGKPFSFSEFAFKSREEQQ